MTLPQPLTDTLVELRPQLEALAAARVPDAWLAAGAIRNRIWNRVLGHGGPPDRDWDVAFAGDDVNAEARLRRELPGPWEAVDQRRFGHPTAAHGIASWPETATALGARLTERGLEVLAPWGTHDVLAGIVRRAPLFTSEHDFRERLLAKGWLQRWPTLHERPWSAGTPDLKSIVVPAFFRC